MEKNINVDETTLDPVKEFTYPGSIIARDGHIEAELQKRMAPSGKTLEFHNVSIRVKGKYTERSYYPPCCTGQRHGRCIGGT